MHTNFMVASLSLAPENGLLPAECGANERRPLLLPAPSATSSVDLVARSLPGSKVRRREAPDAAELAELMREAPPKNETVDGLFSREKWRVPLHADNSVMTTRLLLYLKK